MKQFFIAIGATIFLLNGCSDHSEQAAVRERLIAEGMEIKIEEFRTREWKKCLDRARTLAIAEADSVIRARAREEAVEPVNKPAKPERPMKPETRILPDSLREKILEKDGG